jgi:hypothetical protein
MLIAFNLNSPLSLPMPHPNFQQNLRNELNFYFLIQVMTQLLEEMAMG